MTRTLFIIFILSIINTPLMAKTDQKKSENSEKSEKISEFKKYTAWFTVGIGKNYPDGTIKGTGDQERKLSKFNNLLIGFDYNLNNNFAFGMDSGYTDKEFKVEKTYNGNKLSYSFNSTFINFSPKVSFTYLYFHSELSLIYNYMISENQSYSYSGSPFNFTYDAKSNYELGAGLFIGSKFKINDSYNFKAGIKTEYYFTKVYENNTGDSLKNISFGLFAGLGYEF